MKTLTALAVASIMVSGCASAPHYRIMTPAEMDARFDVCIAERQERRGDVEAVAYSAFVCRCLQIRTDLRGDVVRCVGNTQAGWIVHVNRVKYEGWRWTDYGMPRWMDKLTLEQATVPQGKRDWVDAMTAPQGDSK